jgi:endonuclease/exonuclease/phosphatase family metal-dependent hydrolase
MEPVKKLTLGTFNVNNLFSRFNFQFEAEVPDLKPGKIEIKRVRTIVGDIEKESQYEGKALTSKPLKDRERIAERIREMDLDVLCLQEVEDIETLRAFITEELKTPRYPFFTLIEGNDPRLIDLAVLSKYPLGAVTTWQYAVHPKRPKERVFSRDLLQVEILSADRKDVLVTVFNNHLKSHFVPFTEDQKKGAKEANARRQHQAEVAAQIIAAQMDKQARYAVLGDFNDDISSPYLKPLVGGTSLGLVNGLAAPEETRIMSTGDMGLPGSPAWTHRFKASGQQAEYTLFDHIWLSPALAAKQTGAFINRRAKLTRDGSDHDPAWVELNIG